MTADSKPVVRVSFSADGGENFAAPLTVDANSPIGRGDASFLPDGTLIVTWYADSQDPHLAARAYTHEGEAGPALRIAAVSGSRRSGRPRIATNGNNKCVVVWTSNQEGRTQVRSATLSLKQPE